MPVNADLVALCLQPIAGDNPAGADLRYDVRLGAIKEARREEDLPGSERKVADWGAVVATTSQLLGKETKDLQLAVWLAEALMRKQGPGGLATGLAVLNGLVSQFWEGVHPLPQDEDGVEDPEIRAAPLEWMASRLVLPMRLSPLLREYSMVDIDAAYKVPTEEEAKSSSAKQTLRDQAIAAGKATPEAIAEASGALSKANIRAILADLRGVQHRDRPARQGL